MILHLENLHVPYNVSIPHDFDVIIFVILQTKLIDKQLDSNL